DPVVITPLVRSNSLYTSIAPPFSITRPAELLISMLWNLLVPVKFPIVPPSVCTVVPEKDTVADGDDPEPLLKLPLLYRSMVPWIISFLLLSLLSSVGPSITRLLQKVMSLFGSLLVPVRVNSTLGRLLNNEAIIV